MHHQWRFITLFIILAIMLTGCGDDGGNTDNTSNPNTTNNGGDPNDPGTDPASLYTPTPPPPTNTPLPPPPRERAEPESDPYSFEPPFSVGGFVRQTLRGNVTAVRAGGQQATYTSGTETIVVKIYYFDLTSDAVATVESTLNASNIVGEVGEAYMSPAVTFGKVQDKHGAYLAAWSNYHWTFVITAPNSLETLNAFLDAFPY